MRMSTSLDSASFANRVTPLLSRRWLRFSRLLRGVLQAEALHRLLRLLWNSPFLHSSLLVGGQLRTSELAIGSSRHLTPLAVPVHSACSGSMEVKAVPCWLAKGAETAGGEHGRLTQGVHASCYCVGSPWGRD